MHPRRSEAARVEPDDGQLVARMVGRDQSAMAELYDRTNQIVYGLALRILGDEAAAEDVMVEVYTKAWKLAADYDPSRGTAAAWLLVMTRTRAVDILRARQRDRASEPLETVRQLSSEAPGPEALTLAAERHRFVHGALGRLSNEQRQLMELAYFGGMSHSEIAAALGQPLGTVKTRIRSAMMQLRQLLAPLDAPMPVAKEGL
jgi:RNA polymerase sigma-70 factor (ECF subfamily)